MLKPYAPRLHLVGHERQRISAELNAAPPPAEVIALHPAVLARYEQQLVRLQEAFGRRPQKRQH